MSLEAGLELHWFDLREQRLLEERWLSGQERERAARFIDGRLQRRYVASHVALRRLLAQRMGMLPGDIAIAAPTGAKPRLASAQADGLFFNLARSGDVAVIALGDGLDVGVDVEHEHPLFLSDDFRDLALTAHERAALDGMTPPERASAARRLWVRKEAVLKTLGIGLRLPPSSVATGDPAPTGTPRAIESLGVRWIDVRTPSPHVTTALAWRQR
jgi:4'-phosphopantetheinyl transferase